MHDFVFEYLEILCIERLQLLLNVPDRLHMHLIADANYSLSHLIASSSQTFDLPTFLAKLLFFLDS